MFKYTDDEIQFAKILSTYIAEFGAHSLTIHLPRRVDNVVNKNLLNDMKIRFWRKNEYAITVAGSTAIYSMIPQD